jgi:hypothetical protein
MRRINDPVVVHQYLVRLTDNLQYLTVAQARLMLASRGIRCQYKAIRAALKLPVAATTITVPQASKTPKKVRLKPLDDLPLTPKEREIMERLRRKREEDNDQ